MADQDVNMDDISIQDNTSHRCEDVQEKTAIKRDEAVNSVDKKEITSPSLAEEGSRTDIQSSPNLPVAASNVSLKEDNLLKRNVLEDSEPSIQIDSGKPYHSLENATDPSKISQETTENINTSPPPSNSTELMDIGSDSQTETDPVTNIQSSILDAKHVSTIDEETEMDEAMETCMKEDEDEIDALSSISRKPRSHIRNPKYPSIIRTRRSHGSDVSTELVTGTKNKPKDNSQSTLSKTKSVEESSEGEEMEQKEKRPGRGRGRGGMKHKSTEKGLKPNSLDESTKSGHKSSLVTRAAAAGMKTIQFHQLSRKPKRQRRTEKSEGEEEDEEEEEQLEPLLKKGKVEKTEEDEEESEEPIAEEKEPVSLRNQSVSESVKGSLKPSTRGRGRGKGRRGRVGKGDTPVKQEPLEIETTEEKQSVPKKKWKKDEGDGDTEKEKYKEDKKEEEKEVPVKKKRGRPKKKTKEPVVSTVPTEETSETTPTNIPTPDPESSSQDVSDNKQGTSSDKIDVPLNINQMTEPVKHPDQIVQLLQLSENMGGDEEINDKLHSSKNSPPSESVQSNVCKAIEVECMDKQSVVLNTSPKSNPSDSPAVTNDETEVKDKQCDDIVKSVDVTPSEDKFEKIKEEKEIKEEYNSESDIKLEKQQRHEPNDLSTQQTNDDVSIVSSSETQLVTSSTVLISLSSQPLPSNAMPVEPTYVFSHRYLEDQNYTHPPHPFTHMPHPFLTHGYPPFTTPYTFMSPHFAHPYPHECIPPGMYPHFPEELQQFHRFPIPSPVTCTSSSVSTNSTQESTHSPTMEQRNETTPTSSTPTPTPPAHGMPIPHPLSQPYPPPSHIHPSYTLPSPYGPTAILGAGIPPLIGDWSMAPPQVPPPAAQPPPMLPSPTVKTKESPRFPLNLIPTDDTVSMSHPVDCPECGRHFKNNKALNGHMRLHGGFDWTRRPYQVMQSKQALEHSKEEGEKVDKQIIDEDKERQVDEEQHAQGEGKEVRKNKRRHSDGKHSTKNGLRGSSKSDPSPPSEGRHMATLDDLCRAAEELERIDRNGIKNKPTPLILPHERRITSFSPPYTPPPILSPARSLMMLSSGGGNMTSLHTPNKIWPQRKVSDQRQLEAEELLEPKINIGQDFQADLPTYKKAKIVYENEEPHGGTLVWKPLHGLSQEDEDTIDGYLELACSPAIPHGGRNKELAMHLLHQVGGSVKEAVRLLVMGKSLVTSDDEMFNYNYTGSKRWSSKERQQFRRAWRTHRKKFTNAIDTKSFHNIIEYYYSWKKYCPDEYRGRNRHVSEDVLSEEEDGYVRPSSATSNSSGSNDADNIHSHVTNGTNSNPSSSTSSAKSSPVSHDKTNGGKVSSGMRIPTDVMEQLPRGYVGGQSLNPFSSSFSAPIQEYRCKYPGCNQVYTSIFALNGHIRIHGGSWYPKKPDVENMQSGSKEFSPPPVPPPHMSSSKFKRDKDKEEEEKLRHQLEIAKTMVMDLPQPRSPAHSLGSHTPSPKPSPSRGKSSLVRSKKACSSSPADREGYYPCNRCGRVFHKVKSRSAHMKSHIIKQVH